MIQNSFIILSEIQLKKNCISHTFVRNKSSLPARGGCLFCGQLCSALQDYTGLTYCALTDYLDTGPCQKLIRGSEGGGSLDSKYSQTSCLVYKPCHMEPTINEWRKSYHTLIFIEQKKRGKADCPFYNKYARIWVDFKTMFG